METNANEYKMLCEQADEMSKKVNKGAVTTNGWLVVDNNHDKRSNRYTKSDGTEVKGYYRRLAFA